MQAVLSDRLIHRRNRAWLDYTADVGRVHATYSIASLLARPVLEVGDAYGADSSRRWRVLVLGGDQVYPTASGWRTAPVEGPYRAALPVRTRERRPLCAAG
jgi:hypothetical protein